MKTTAGKYKALDIANLYIDLANGIPNHHIDNLKVNKLCYYAQAWSIARLGYPLFSDEIEAWKYGPLIPSVYYAYKVCGKNPVEEPTYHFKESDLTSKEISLLIDVYNTYGKYTSGALIDKTHENGSPYCRVYEDEQNNVIPLDLLEECFKGSDELETFKPNITAENVIAYV